VVRLDVSREGDRLRVRAKARDEASPLRTAQVSLNSKEWKIVDPVDQIFDGLEEDFDFTIPSGEGEELIVGFRVIDQAGNAAVGRAALR